MTHHNKYDEVKTLVKADIPVLLTGEKGSGKTTLAIQIAETLELEFFSMSMTRQTTLSHLLGFLSVNGEYVPSQLFKAAIDGGLYLLDEIDAADANVVLTLNTIENGYISFPTGIVKLHKDFRIMGTANPQNEHEFYVGRSKLDAATLDRFDIVEIPRDDELEKTLVDFDTHHRIELMRKVLKEANSSIKISMRDSMRYQKRKDLGIDKDFVERLAGDNPIAIQNYAELLKNIPKHSDQSECHTFDELVDLINIQSGVYDTPKAAKVPDEPLPF